jgi:hypothetical protein
MKIDDLFISHSASSKSFKSHKAGDVAFVTNGYLNNGILGYVKQFKSERVFNFEGICVSAFCEATVQNPPFLPRGNGGSGLIVLEPRNEMSYTDLLFYSAYINKYIKWRFSYGRMVTGDRLRDINIPEIPKKFTAPSIKDIMPKPISRTESLPLMTFSEINIGTLFDIVKGAGEYLIKCKEGNTPLISATRKNNGVLGYVNLPPTFKAPAITIERVGGNAFVQLEDFATVPDDLFVLIPKIDMPLEILYYVISVIKNEKWRFNYSRKLTSERFLKLNIKFPTKQDTISEFDNVKKIVNSVYGWGMIASSNEFSKTKNKNNGCFLTLDNF